MRNIKVEAKRTGTRLAPSEPATPTETNGSLGLLGLGHLGVLLRILEVTKECYEYMGWDGGHNMSK